jgi:hypothetical protein
MIMAYKYHKNNMIHTGMQWLRTVRNGGKLYWKPKSTTECSAREEEEEEEYDRSDEHRPIPGSRSYTLNSSHENLRTRIF